MWLTHCYVIRLQVFIDWTAIIPACFRPMLSFLLLSLLLASTPALAVWPIPRQYSTGSTPLRLSPSFSIKLSGVSHPPSDLQDAISRTKSYLHKDKLQALVPDRGASSAKEIQSAKSLKSLTLSLSTNGPIKSISEEAVADLESRVEGYTLTIPADGSGASLSANSTLGLFRGLTTFGQLWYDLDGATYTLQAPFDIVDSPAFVRNHRYVGGSISHIRLSHTAA